MWREKLERRKERGTSEGVEWETTAVAGGVVPLLARSRAVSLPMPVLAPVMMTVFPSSLSSDDQRWQHTLLGAERKERVGGGYYYKYECFI